MVVRRLLLLVVLLLTACSGSSTVDFGPSSAGSGGSSAVRSDEVDAMLAPVPDEIPPEDARLFEGGWPEAAAYVRREAEAGNPVLVNIFASWCGPCRNEMPMLTEAAEDNPDVTFLGIDHQDRFEDGEEFVDEFDVDFATIHDIEGDVAHNVGGIGMPTTVVFDADGKLAERVVGEVTESTLAELLDAARG